LEEHAVRGCLAALAIQDEAKEIAVDVHNRDGVELCLRVGLNSGQVIAGEIGSGPLGYTAIGEQVGMAQRMESVAAPGGVMLSASTARLVDAVAALGDPELVRIKGAEEPVTAHRLLGMHQDRQVSSAKADLVGRQWEMAASESLLQRAVDGNGAVVALVGSPGIGKSRLAREITQMAAAQGIDVVAAYCESHTTDIPFHVVARLLRAATDVSDVDGPTARDRVRARVPDADPEDLLLLDDLLGIADPNVPLPAIDPDARRRRLTALVNAISLARQTPAVFVVEDAHWIDEVSESMLTGFLAVIPQTPSLVLVTYRPEYVGALARVHGAQTIALAPLSDPETTALVSRLLGPDPSVGAVATVVAERAAGNPFFAEEIVRDLAERGVLRGNHGAYESSAVADEVAVPATLQATIAARIDRLGPTAKHTLSAAAVIGSRFSRGLLETLGIDPVLEDLVSGEFIDQISFTREPEYVFHHPLIRTVAYESRLKSDRAELHRRVADAIESHDPNAADDNAALIAEHLQAAGELRAAYGWHMRAATWATNRDVGAARISWERARDIADRLTEDTDDRLATRIAPRTMLCGIGWRVHANVAATHFGELRELCGVAGDKSSLAVAMAGLMLEQAFVDGRLTDAVGLAAELMTLLESIGDDALMVDLSFSAMHTACEAGMWAEALRWGDNAVSRAAGERGLKGLLIGSPLAVTVGIRGLARAVLRFPGWRNDLDTALEVASHTDPLSHALAIAYRYTAAIPMGLLRADEGALRDTEEALRVVQNSGDDMAVGYGRLSRGIVLLQSDSPADRGRGVELLRQAQEMSGNRPFSAADRPIIDAYLAYDRARHGDHDAALKVLRDTVDGLVREGLLLGWGVACTNLLVECLMNRGTDSDLREAEAATERLAAAGAGHEFVFLDCVVLHARALLARARGDESTYREFRDRYRETAAAIGYEGHLARAEAMS
jgi:hypothetical protein